LQERSESQEIRKCGESNILYSCANSLTYVHELNAIHNHLLSFIQIRLWQV